jgi:succinate-acetate transporter protein
MHDFCIHRYILFFRTFRYLICIFMILYELVLVFTSLGICKKRKQYDTKLLSVTLLGSAELG